MLRRIELPSPTDIAVCDRFDIRSHRDCQPGEAFETLRWLSLSGTSERVDVDREIRRLALIGADSPDESDIPACRRLM